MNALNKWFLYDIGAELKSPANEIKLLILFVDILLSTINSLRLKHGQKLPNFASEKIVSFLFLSFSSNVQQAPHRTSAWNFAMWNAKKFSLQYILSFR